MPVKNLGNQLCVEGFISGVKRLMEAIRVLFEGRTESFLGAFVKL
jgi:hypothetical protein